MQDWESYWKTVSENEGKTRIFWDTDPEVAALEDLQRLKPYMDADLPLVDLGCGSGKQTRFFARHFHRVIGVDISASAVQLAREETGAEYNIMYRVLDAANNDEALAFHQEYGDVNIYMRGVLHMIKVVDRQQFVSNLRVMLGEKGVLYQIELPTRAFYLLRSLPEEMWSSIPKVVRRVGFNLEDRAAHFPEDQWIVLAEGDDAIIHTAQFEGSLKGGLPANYLMLKHKT